MADRKKAFSAFADREVEVLLNCQLWIEGFDMEAQVGRPCVIECVLDYAPTQSLARHLQKLGRGLRRDDGGDPHILLDLVGGISRLGFPDDERQWSLDGKTKDKREVKVTDCPECACSHHPAPKCPECGHVYEKGGGAGPAQIQEVDGDLEEIDVEALRRQRNMEQARAETLEDLVNLATARGYKSPKKWAAHVWTARQAKSRAVA